MTYIKAANVKTQYTVVEEISLSYRYKVKPADRPLMNSARIVYSYFMQQWNADSIDHVEEFKIMLLSRSSRLLGIVEISKGGVAGTIVDLKIIFQAALKANASTIILCHNHPSHRLTPSEADKSITQRIKEACKIMDITLTDHLIICTEGYFSFAEDGLL